MPKQIDEVTGLSRWWLSIRKRRAGTTAKGLRPQVKLLDEMVRVKMPVPIRR